MFNLIKQQVASDYFQQNFPNDGQRFVAWYLRNVLFRDMNETKADITDGADDKQIDAIIVDDDKIRCSNHPRQVYREWQR